MRLHADFTGTQRLSYIERGWRGMKRSNRKARSEAKREYRQRERAALKRDLNELVLVEMAVDVSEVY